LVWIDARVWLYSVSFELKKLIRRWSEKHLISTIKMLIMKKTELLLLGLFTMLAAVIWMSCKKDSGGGGSKTPSASIKDTSQTINESAATASIIVNLSAATSQALKLNFTLSGTAILNGDYEMDSTSSITIPAGSSSGTLNFRIFNDPATEPSKTIHVKFSSTGNVTFATSEATITIQDNDPSRASTGLQTDLTWDAGSLVDLDLLVVNNLVIDTVHGAIQSFNIVDSSENDKGFESVLIKNSSADGDYYLVVAYVGPTTGARAVNFTVNANGPGGANASLDDTFAAGDQGFVAIYGPITKVGSAFTFRGSGSIFDLSHIKRYIYRGKFR
jgi:hypothetical protein